MECKEGTLFGTNSNRDICRTCLSSDDVKPIFESYYEDVNVADLLKICISLEVRCVSTYVLLFVSFQCIVHFYV